MSSNRRVCLLFLVVLVSGVVLSHGLDFKVVRKKSKAGRKKSKPFTLPGPKETMVMHCPILYSIATFVHTASAKNPFRVGMKPSFYS